MIFDETPLKGAFVVEINKLQDKRGFFGRIFCRQELESQGLRCDVVQSSLSFNAQKGTLRGMHFQISPHQETKLVRCTRGALYDVIVDLRPGSPTYKQWYGIELSQDNYKTVSYTHLTLPTNREV